MIKSMSQVDIKIIKCLKKSLTQKIENDIIIQKKGDSMNKLYEGYKEYSFKVDGKPVVFFFNSGLSLEYKPGRLSYKHSHFHSELFGVFKGEMRIFTDEGEISIGASEAVLVPKGVSHKTEYDKNIFRVVVAFSEPKNGNTPFLKRLSDATESGKILRYKNPHFIEILNHILHYERGNYKFREQLIEGCLRELLALVCQDEEREDKGYTEHFSEGKNYRNYLLDVIFDDAFSSGNQPVKAPTLPQIAKTLHISEKQTERTIMELYGRNFREQITYLRMRKAKELLLSTDLSINEISMILGYTAARSFFAFFKKCFGVTPTEFRRYEKTI